MRGVYLTLCRVEVRKLEESDRASRSWFSVYRAESFSTANNIRDDQSRVSYLVNTRTRLETRKSYSWFTMDAERASSPVNLNDLFDYDVGLDEIFQGNGASNANADTKPAGDPSLGLGLDEEVKVTKKRQPVAKLDEGR